MRRSPEEALRRAEELLAFNRQMAARSAEADRLCQEGNSLAAAGQLGLAQQRMDEAKALSGESLRLTLAFAAAWTAGAPAATTAP